MSDRVAIVGAAQSLFSPKRVDANYAELAHEVIEAVLNQTGLAIPADIDNAISCSHDIWDGQTISNIGITDVIGGHLRNEEKTAMDGSTAVYYGTIGILSGEFRCTLLLAHTKMSPTPSTRGCWGSTTRRPGPFRPGATWTATASPRSKPRPWW
jgi:acetyl-CoA C-acetyltransferase